MLKEIRIPDYSPERGVGYVWHEQSKVECIIQGNDILINANEEGLESLANCLLSLAQNKVPENRHIHLDDIRKGFKGSPLVLVKKLTLE